MPGLGADSTCQDAPRVRRPQDERPQVGAADGVEDVVPGSRAGLVQRRPARRWGSGSPRSTRPRPRPPAPPTRSAARTADDREGTGHPHGSLD